MLLAVSVIAAKSFLSSMTYTDLWTQTSLELESAGGRDLGTLRFVCFVLAVSEEEEEEEEEEDKGWLMEVEKRDVSLPATDVTKAAMLSVTAVVPVVEEVVVVDDETRQVDKEVGADTMLDERVGGGVVELAEPLNVAPQEVNSEVNKELLPLLMGSAMLETWQEEEEE